MPAKPLTPTAADQPATGKVPGFAPLLKKLLILQLALVSLWGLASVGYALFMSSSQQQRALALQAKDLAQALGALPRDTLTQTELPEDSGTAGPALNTLLQWALNTNRQLVAIELQVATADGHNLANVAHRSTQRGATQQTNLHEAKTRIRLPAATGEEAPLLVTLALRARPQHNLPGPLLLAGWLTTLLVSLAALLAINRQLRNESIELQGKLQPKGLDVLPGYKPANKQAASIHYPAGANAEPMVASKGYVLLPGSLATAAAQLREKASALSLEAKPDLTPSVSLQELELAQQSAVKANRIKSNIIAKTSHELLTPLNSISGFAEILTSDLPETSELGEFARLIHENALYLNTLVNDLIVFSDRETNAVKLHYASTGIYSLLTSIAKTFAPTVENHGLVWRENFDAVESVYFDTDPVRLRQILSNLLTNALRNTEQGYISLEAQLEEPDTGNCFLVLSVSDSGCGIAVDKQEAIFSAFVSNSPRASAKKGTTTASSGDSSNATPHNDKTRDAGLGFGLGLAIVDDLCSRLGASIELHSKINQGSTFTVRLPVRNLQRREPGEPAASNTNQQTAHPKAALADKQQTAPGNSYSVLIVDDIACNRRLLQHLLQSLGFNCSGAASGSEALALLAKQKFSLLFLDIRMTPMNGTTLLKHIRKLPGYYHTPVVGCTAHVAENERRQLIDSGFDVVLHKPLSAEKIARLCNQLLKFEAAAHLPDGAQPFSKTVNYATTSGNNQLAGLQRLKSLPENRVYDVDAAIAHCGGNAQVAREICELIIEELEQSLTRQQQGFANHKAMLDHYHRLNGSASMGGTATLKALLYEFETLLKSTPDNTHPKILAQQNAVTEQQSALLAWLRGQDLERLFARTLP